MEVFKSFMLIQKQFHMPDNKQNTGEPDRSRINTGEDYEVKYWATQFAVSAEELIDAVQALARSISSRNISSK
jgi:hypothetical protein